MHAELTVDLSVQPDPQPGNFNSGENTRFMTLAQENGSWKINGITASPSELNT